jgi:hypothetical protein
METIKLRTHVGEDGIVKLEFPVNMINREFEVLVVIQPVMKPIETEALDAMGYPIGYFDETYGSLADDPIERPEQLPIDIRDEIE